jgi:hypothetical protein
VLKYPVYTNLYRIVIGPLSGSHRALIIYQNNMYFESGLKKRNGGRTNVKRLFVKSYDYKTFQ